MITVGERRHTGYSHAWSFAASYQMESATVDMMVSDVVRTLARKEETESLARRMSTC